MVDEGWGGYAKLFRIIKTRSWYKNRNATLLYVNCVLNASYEAGTYMGIHYKKGQFVSSYRKLSEETGLSIKEVRTALKILKESNDITQKVLYGDSQKRAQKRAQGRAQEAPPKCSLFTVSTEIGHKKRAQEGAQKRAHIKEIKEGEGRSDELALPKEVVWEVPRSIGQRSNKDKKDEQR